MLSIYQHNICLKFRFWLKFVENYGADIIPCEASTQLPTINLGCSHNCPLMKMSRTKIIIIEIFYGELTILLDKILLET